MGPFFWASWRLSSRNPSDCTLGSSRDEFWEFPGRFRQFRNTAGEISRQNLKSPIQALSSSGWKTRLPRKVQLLTPRGGKPWPLLRRAIFARRRADPNPDLSQTLAGDPAGANGASNGGIRAEIRPSLGFLGFRARFARRLLNSGRDGSLPGRRLAGAGASAGEPAGSPAGLRVARNGRFGITGSTWSHTAGQHHQVHHGAASPRGAPRRLPTP